MGTTDKDIREIVVTGLKLRAQGKKLEQEAKKLKDDGNDLLAPVLELLDGRKAEVELIGSAIITSTQRSKLDMKQFKSFLLQKGVDAQLIADAESLATSMTETESVVFRPWKEKA